MTRGTARFRRCALSGEAKINGAHRERLALRHDARSDKNRRGRRTGGEARRCASVTKVRSRIYSRESRNIAQSISEDLSGRIESGYRADPYGPRARGRRRNGDRGHGGRDKRRVIYRGERETEKEGERKTENLWWQVSPVRVIIGRIAMRTDEL